MNGSPRRARTGGAAIVTLAAIVLVAAGCGGSGGSPAASVASTPAPATPAASASSPAAAESAPATGATAVSIKGFRFNPGTITVSAGSTVTWTNEDSAAHTVTADDGSWDSRTLAGAATFSQVFSTPGTYAYHCAIHTSMTATVVVR